MGRPATSAGASPKFIAGESYGTTRTAGLALHLQRRHGLYLNGLVMISSILNWQNQEMHPGNDTAFAIPSAELCSCRLVSRQAAARALR